MSGLKEICFTTEAFGKMSKLRLLVIGESSLFDDSDDSDDSDSDSECSNRQMQCKVHISDDFKFHNDELRFLIWQEYPLKSLPSDFKSENLVFLAMPNSHLTQLWQGNKVRLIYSFSFTVFILLLLLLLLLFLDNVLYK